MREWIPVPGSTRGDLALGAVHAFADRGYAATGVGELAAVAGVTTGSLYHHFGSKLGLYRVVRDDVERRAVDRMAGAAAARTDEGPPAALDAALTVSFDWATAQGWARLLAEPHPGRDTGDPVVSALAEIGSCGRVLATVLLAAWRAALLATVDGEPVGAARAALATIRVANR